MELVNGKFLKGNNYKIISKISKGNFGITYLAEQTSLDRKVCIKEFFFQGSCERSVNGQVTVTTSGQEVTDSFRRKFMREAKRLSKFDHPNIVKVIDVFEENGTAYMVMDYVEGETLQQLVDRKGKLSEKEALEYIISLCDALEVVHEKKLLHLDIKPSNILIKRQNNTPVLIDFGISKFTEVSGEDHSTTSPVALTKGYAPLEQYGQDITKLTALTDVYSVAATLYKLVTGVTPPEAAVIVQDGIKPPNEINLALSERLNSIILKSLSVKPSHRALSISKLKADLKGVSKEAVVPETDGDTEVLGEIKNQESHVYTAKATDEQPIHYEPVRESKNSIVLWLAAIAIILITVAIVTRNKNSESIFTNEIQKTEVTNEAKPAIVDEEQVFIVVDDQAIFQGGDVNTFRDWVTKNLKYPTIAIQNGIQGTVYVQFAVNSIGDVVDVKVVRGVDYSINEEAVRVIMSSPKWYPAKVRGIQVKQQFTIPIAFILQ